MALFDNNTRRPEMMNTTSHPSPSATRPLPQPPQHALADDTGHDDTHVGLLDGFHWPPTVEERRALRHAADALVGPGGA